ncbi:MAG: rRNA maturation RNase YbeY [Bacteroidia bacterium]|nr:rRNA maturation RNase YbeY [Bacteroidia bacterium]
MGKETAIHFFKEEVKFRLGKQAKLCDWLISCARKEGYKINTLNYIFCTDDYLLSMNNEYLGHNYFTDIITFDYNVEKNNITGDVFISIDTVNKNSLRFNTTFQNELHRVMIHGLLHLVGYRDKTEKEKQKMKSMEDKYLAFLA